MPIPKPNKGESHKEFMGRCMANPTMNSEYPEADQRAAVCQSSWENTKEKSMPPMKGLQPETVKVPTERVQRKLLTEVQFAVEDSELGERQIRVRAASGKADRVGDIVDIEGIDIGNFKKNPIILWAHDHYGLPVAKAVKISKSNALDMVFQFPTAEEYSFADTVYKLVKGKYINGVSIGARVKEAEWIKDKEGRVIGRKFTSLELLEVSIVPIPADSKALITAVKSGTASIEVVEECLSKSFEDTLDLIEQNPVDITTYSGSNTSDSVPPASEPTDQEEDMSKYEEQLQGLNDRITAIEGLLKAAAQHQTQASKSLDALNGLVSTISEAVATRQAPNLEKLKGSVENLPLDGEVTKKLSEILDGIGKKLSTPR